LKQTGPVFILPAQPKPGDRREYNAFGYLTGFGKAYAEYYARQDAARAKQCSTG
jgi:hypothetical protein